ncbi:hypothetical protein [Geodermatophilus amargosae]|uniref:hypothetical protein n=1 Tax=Geodermatophilus amargosae TaxID=1296565 RepID=UPI0034DF21A7
MLAPTVTFHSPVADHHGCDDVAHLLTVIGRCLGRVQERVEYAAGTRFAVEFTAEVEGDPVTGVLVWQVDDNGMVQEVTLMPRPLSALHVAVAFMRSALAEDPLPSARRDDGDPSREP